MRNKYFLLFVLCLSVFRLSAQTPTKTLTAEELNTATDVMEIAIKGISATNNYWFCGDKSLADMGDETIWLWEPADNGTHLLKKKNPLAEQGEGYLQQGANGANLTFGERASAQPFQVVLPSLPGPSDPPVGDADLNDGKVVRFAVPDGSYWINIQGTAGPAKYNTGQGLWTMYNVYVLGQGEPKPEPEPEPEPDPDPVPEPDPAHTIYNIVWKNNTTSYITEEADGSLVIAPYDVTQRQFWEFIPTDNPNCYYIRNTATGRYIGSCDMTPSSSSKVKTTDQPVEYYVGATAATSGEIKGCFWLSSTDCDHYDQESAGPRALNKDGASSSIITWQAGTSRVGSYWTLAETENLYEVRPFQLSDEVGRPKYEYTVTSLGGKVLAQTSDGGMAWQENTGDIAQNWYFVGENNQSGYRIVNSKTHQSVGGADARWSVLTGSTGAATYFFRPTATRTEEGTALAVEGDSLWQFVAQRSAYARKNQIYEMPCGKTGVRYIQHMSIDGDVMRIMEYPLPSLKTGQLMPGKATKPSGWYVLYTQDKAAVWGNFRMHVTMSGAPAAGEQIFVYADWNRDGVFETMQEVEPARIMDFDVVVPENAQPGPTRLRVRYTDNGLAGAEDEVTGYIYDIVVEVVERPETFVVTARPNDPTRGQVSQERFEGVNDACTVKATPLGNAQFVCWREGHRVLAGSEELAFVLMANRQLTAVFSPNTDDTPVGIDAVEGNGQNLLVDVQADGRRIEVETTAEVTRVMVFDVNGALVATAQGKVVELPQVVPGTYIVKVFTREAHQAVKVAVK